MRRRIGLALLLLLTPLLWVPNAYCAEEQPQAGAQELSNPFSDFVPFEDEYDIDEDERFMYFGRFFGVSLGTGLHTYGGNLGRLYNTALPVMDFRLIYFFDFRLAGQIGISTASHAFVVNEQVRVNMLRINADLKYYFDTQNMGATITVANPYAVGGLSRTFRTQTFEEAQLIEKDNTFELSGGLGMEFALKPRKTSIGIEGRIHQNFFKDRYDTDYAVYDVPDRTGNMYSIITNLIFFF